MEKGDIRCLSNVQRVITFRLRTAHYRFLSHLYLYKLNEGTGVSLVNLTTQQRSVLVALAIHADSGAHLPAVTNIIITTPGATLGPTQ